MDGHRMAIFCDPAATAKTHSDRSAFGVCAMRGFGDACVMDVVDAVHARLTPPQLAASLVSMWRSWKAQGAVMPVCIEAIGTGIFLPDLVRAMAPEIASHVMAIKSGPIVKVTADKYTRSQPLARAYNEGRVRFAAESWTAGAVAELLAFTGLDDPHDDFVDFAAHGWNTLYRAAPQMSRGLVPVSNLSFG
jgi:predicted phage terminase large subunit-like protein